MSEYVNVEANGLRYVVNDVVDLEAEEWREVQGLDRDAYLSAPLPRDVRRPQVEEVDYLVSWDRPEYFAASRVDPMVAVREGRLLEGNSYADPLITRVFHGSDLVAEAWSANNTSGRTGIERALKMRGTSKKYDWFWSLATDPDFRDTDVAKTAVYVSIGDEVQTAKKRDPEQPVSAYTLGAYPMARLAIMKFGFEPTGVPRPVRSFGPDRPATTITRLQRNSIRALSEDLRESGVNVAA